MCDGNYIKLNRKILDWEWFSDLNTLAVWLFILCKANWKDGKFQGVDVPRGSLVTSYEKIAAGCGISKHQARTAIDHLKSTGEVALKSHTKFSLITVVNYDRYQLDGTQDGTQVSRKRHSSGTQVATIEECNKGIKKESKNIYGEYRHIRLTSEEHSRLVEEFGEDVCNKAIQIVDEYCQQSGKTYKDYNLAIRKWAIDRAKNEVPKKHNPYSSDLYRSIFGDG